MLKYNHRNVVVIDEGPFKILTVIDVLDAQEKGIDLQKPLSSLNLNSIPTISKDKNVLDTLSYLNESIEYICVLNNDNSLYGIVAHTDITSNIDPETLMDNYKLTDYLKLNRRMKWVNKDEILSKLLKEMIKISFDNIVIVDDMKPIGILTTKDIMRLINNNINLDAEIFNFMSSPVHYINKNSSIREALEFVKQRHYKRVIVVDDDEKLVGIITQKELISLTYSKWSLLMKEYQEELAELNHILENKNKEYEIKASIEPLTGLYNRYKFSELYLSSYKSMTQRYNDMSLIMLDIDFFKKINDTYGHNTGDEVLKKLAKTLKTSLRDIDIICRWGGEEFLILLPTVNLKKAYKIAQKLKESIKNMQIKQLDKNITASFGVSQVKEGDTMESAIERADKALYLAKNNGRDCVKTELEI
jgi:diguanylate cyclase (GGDEF)-like protein